MGIDLRTGKQDCNKRYRVYTDDVNILDKEDLLKHYLGTIHCKDGSSYRSAANNIANSFEKHNISATLETYDLTPKIKPNYMLYSLNEHTFYIIDEVTEESNNNNEIIGRRPSIKRVIYIRKGVE